MTLKGLIWKCPVHGKVCNAGEERLIPLHGNQAKCFRVLRLGTVSDADAKPMGQETIHAFREGTSATEYFEVC